MVAPPVGLVVPPPVSIPPKLFEGMDVDVDQH